MGAVANTSGTPKGVHGAPSPRTETEKERASGSTRQFVGIKSHLMTELKAVVTIAATMKRRILRGHMRSIDPLLNRWAA